MKHTSGPWEAKKVSGAGLQIWATVDLGPSEHEGADRVSGPLLQPIYRVEIKPSLVVGDDGKAYAMLSYEDWRQFPSIRFKEMQEANARLIAAAPDLLSALEELVDEASSLITHFDINRHVNAKYLWQQIEKARAAIAKVSTGSKLGTEEGR